MDWYNEYCKDFGYCEKPDRRGKRDADRLKRRLEKIGTLGQEDISSFTDRTAAEAHLEQKAIQMYGSFGFVLFQALISWVIKKILDRCFGSSK